MNLYRYVFNNPVNQVDSTGLDITGSFNLAAAGGFGHVEIGVNINETVGLRVQENASMFQTEIGQDVPGKISLVPATPQNITVPATKEQDRKAQQRIDDEPKVQNFNLFDNNCTRFVSQCLNTAGIETPDTIKPSRLFEWIRWRY